MLKQQTKLRVRLYARLSKDDGDADKESNSITNQLQMLRYNAKEKGFEVIGEYGRWLFWNYLQPAGSEPYD